MTFNQKVYQREYRIKNKKEIEVYGREYRIKNKEKIALTDNKYINSERGYIKETINGIFRRCRRNNNRKKWIPECTKEEIYEELMLYIQDHGRHCEYCKEPWTYSRPLTNKKNSDGRKRNFRISTNFSIDRLDSEKTYTVDNLVFCCIGCNNRKNQVRLSDLINILRVWMPRKIKKGGI